MIRTSVLINNFNHARFLRACVDSVLAQSEPAGEIIVYDDGSTDDSLALLESYGSQIRVISGPRGPSTPWANQAVAIETSFQAATGDLIFLLDGDDVFTRDHIAAYLEAFARSDRVIMVQAPMWKINEQGEVTGAEYDLRRHARDYVAHIQATHEVNIYYPTSALAFRRSYLSSRFPLDFSDGLPLWPDARLTLLAPHYGEIVTLDKPHTLWRRHPASHTVMKKMSVYEQTRANRIYYNAFCVRHGIKPVNPWLSAQQRRRWLRHVCPEFLLNLYRQFVDKRTAATPF